MILVAVPAAALAVVSLAAFFGEWIWWLDVLANFRAQYAVALVVLGAALVLTKWRRTGYGVLAIAAVNIVVVLPLFVGFPGSGEAGAPTIRVMSFNLLSTNDSFGEVIEYINATDPDLVLLHEASRPWEVAMDSAAFEYEIIRPRSDDLIFGTLVLVKGERVRAVSYGFAETQPRAVEITYQPTGWTTSLSVLSTHPLAPTEQHRAELRDAQLAFAGEWAGDQVGTFFVAGDFNATPWSAPFRKMIAASDLINSQSGYGLQPSFPVTSPLVLRIPIDHLLHSPDLIVLDRQLGPAMGSDHFPLLVDLQLKP